MNGWDLFTWINALVLAASAVVIFAYFLRDARAVFERQGRDHDE